MIGERLGGGAAARAAPAPDATRRRGLLLGAGVLFAACALPLVSRGLLAAPGAILAGMDRVGPLCMTFVHRALAPAHAGFQLLLLAGLAYAVWDRWQACARLRRLLAVLPARSPVAGEPIAEAARRAGLRASQVRVVSGCPNPAFTTGCVRPLVYVDAGLAGVLPPEQLRAVLAHEAAHARRFDPVRVSALRFLASVVFWLPVLRRIADDIADETELAADEAAGAEPLSLAAALVALAGWSGQTRPVAAVGITPGGPHGASDALDCAEQRTTASGDDCRVSALLDRRVRRLLGEHPTPRSRVTVWSAALAVCLVALAWASGAVAVHPVSSHPTCAIRP